MKEVLPKDKKYKYHRIVIFLMLTCMAVSLLSAA